MATMTLPLQPPRAAVDSTDPILEIMNDADLTMGEKLLRMEALLVHDSAPAPRLGRGARRARRGALKARVARRA
jgi:hypothetical protein